MLRKTTALLMAMFIALTFAACTNMDGNEVRKNNVDNLTPLDLNKNNRGLNGDIQRDPMGNTMRDDMDRGIDRLEQDTLDGNQYNRDMNRPGSMNRTPAPNMAR